ncbi:MAG: tyrosine-type recombinase/integrase, partial [Phycisphaerae bacterium]|nr:tyrosine-type recombinase/integrase [Phycisphaerae bacterium]
MVEIISPVLANMALDGMEKLLNDRFKLWRCRKGKWQWVTPPDSANERINLIRYADDFVVTGRSSEVLEQQVVPLIREFLAERGLALSVQKTRIVSIEDGFDFLGFRFRKHQDLLLTTPCKSGVRRFREKVKRIIKSSRGLPAHVLIGRLNPVLRGWCNYYRHSASSRTFRQLHDWLFQELWRYLRQTHHRKSGTWLANRYFTEYRGKGWVFHARNPAGNPYAELAGKDSKSGQGAAIPLRPDVAEQVRDFLAGKLAEYQRRTLADGRTAFVHELPLSMPVFENAPTIRVFDRDLLAAGIARLDEEGNIVKTDRRGRTVDLHALRHTFGMHLSKAGVSPRTAQAAMRHSRIDLTMNVYT